MPAAGTAYTNGNFNVKLIISGEDSQYLPTLDTSRIYRFQYEFQLESQNGMYWMERQPYSFTVDLFPDSWSFYQCLLPSVQYLVGTSKWYNIDCL